MSAGAIAHLVPFSTFLPFIASVFEEAAPGENLFLVYGSGDVSQYKVPAGVQLEGVGTAASDLERVGRAFCDSEVAIAHSMSTFSAQAIAAAPQTTLRVWSGWGGDYYGTALNPSAGLLGHATARLSRRRRGLVQWAVDAHSARYVDGLLRSAARSTDVFSAPVPTDLAVFQKRFRGFRGRYSQLNYASVENTYSLPPDRPTANDVLVGNSATPENNHLEVFELLAGLDTGDRRIVVPLSYGDTTYADDVAQAGAELFGDRFVALRGFVPLAEYNGLLASCGTVVMGHRRQQALGNVARAVWQGAHVFLDSRSPILAYFRDQGLSARTLDDLRQAGLPSAARSDDQVAADRAVARSLWGRDVVVDNIRALVASARAR